MSERDRFTLPRYREFIPDLAIAAHVHCTWLFEGTEAGAEQACRRTVVRS